MEKKVREITANEAGGESGRSPAIGAASVLGLGRDPLSLAHREVARGPRSLYYLQ